MTYSYFGRLIRRFEDPSKILKKAKEEEDRRAQVTKTMATVTSPLQTILKRIIYRKTIKKTVTDEAKIRAIINKVLIEHNLL